MNWRHYLLLAMLSLVVNATVAWFQPASGYMDSDYYFAGGSQLASGRGFTEPYLWNYLDDPTGLPHPSHTYWMPLASLLAAAGMILAQSLSWSAARLVFFLFAALIPPLTATLAYSITFRRDLALTSGLLAIFSGFYIPYMSVTDTFGLYMLFGGLFIFIYNYRLSVVSFLLLGFLAGLMNLSRADGLIWLLMSFLAVFFFQSSNVNRRWSISLVFIGYIVVMGFWFARNITIFNFPLVPGSSRLLWLTYYDQIFLYPARQLTYASWWQSGILAILKTRLMALGMNLANAFVVQAGIFLLPLIGIGVWQMHKDRRVQMAVLSWIITLILMTFVFPFAGERGGFLHSGAALQPAWWALAPLGLDATVSRVARWLNWKKKEQARHVFLGGMVCLTALLTVVVFNVRVIGLNSEQTWGREHTVYRQISNYLNLQGITEEAVVIVANPPGFWLASGHPAIAVPDGDVKTVLAIAERYGASYLILEKGSITRGLIPLFENPREQAGLRYLGEVEEARIFVIQP